MGMRSVRRSAWIFGLGLVLLASFGTAFLLERRGVFLPGTTSDGHHLMEASCNSCHSPFKGVSNERCSDCHRAELASDTHPPALFDDPRWAADLEKIDVSSCVTCHSEHHAAQGSVEVRRDFCFVCHSEVAERASHRGLGPTTCADAGCHNYHDDSVLRLEYLRAHQGEPDLRDHPAVRERVLPAAVRPAAVQAPAGLAAPAALVAAWKGSAHAASNVGCASCHERSGRLVLRPGRELCQDCHAFEVDTFLSGKHGLRARADLPALRPRDARLPMKPEAVAGPLELGCTTCHDPHSVDTRRAATQACMGCHDDRHTRSFPASPHARTATGSGRPAGQEVTCATCHLPRVEVQGRDGRRVAVNHNNSLTLAPPDRMAAMVCSSCHGLELSLAAVLDRRLIDNNFSGRPEGRLKSFDMLSLAENER
jgi:hypothetical protein